MKTLDDRLDDIVKESVAEVVARAKKLVRLTYNVAPCRWGVIQRSDNHMRLIIHEKRMPVMFLTRREAVAWIKENYGHVADLPDSMPVPVKVRVVLDVREDVQ